MLNSIPVRWVVAITILGSVAIITYGLNTTVANVALIECVGACGDRLDYYADRECSCKPDEHAPTMFGLTGHE